MLISWAQLTEQDPEQIRAEQERESIWFNSTVRKGPTELNSGPALFHSTPDILHKQIGLLEQQDFF